MKEKIENIGNETVGKNLGILEISGTEDLRKIYLMFLEKLEKLTDAERACIVTYLNLINKPLIVVDFKKPT